MTRIQVLLFVSIVLVAISMMPGWAHVLEMPAKLELSRDQYFAVQQIYRGWAWFGVVIFPALASTLTLALLVRGQTPAYVLSAEETAQIVVA